MDPAVRALESDDRFSLYEMVQNVMRENLLTAILQFHLYSCHGLILLNNIDATLLEDDRISF
jgi:hypothetical protein